MSRKIVGALDSRTATRAVQLVAVVALLLSIYIGIEQRQLTACLAEYNEANNRVTAARYQAAEQDRQAQDAMFRAVADDPRSALGQIRQYTELRAQSDEQRRQNPLPSPPSQRC
ncbi:hypothetical protein [Plantactinospora sp. WMMB782]|uniref:hypothetical protein n=1 Tax=Plantactinospora sp. WMMB782 TaxID=3404121 RepID=UPI003B9574DE